MWGVWKMSSPLHMGFKTYQLVWFNCAERGIVFKRLLTAQVFWKYRSNQRCLPLNWPYTCPLGHWELNGTDIDHDLPSWIRVVFFQLFQVGWYIMKRALILSLNTAITFTCIFWIIWPTTVTEICCWKRTSNVHFRGSNVHYEAVHWYTCHDYFH